MKTKRHFNRKKKFFLIKFFILVALLLIMLVLFALSSFFNIKGIEVIGSKHYSNNEVVGVTDIYVGNNWFKTIGFDINDIFSFRDSKAEESILKSRAYVKSVVVRCQFSGIVRITIIEREPKMIIPYLGANLILDGEGCVLDVDNGNKTEGLPFIKGIKFSNYELGQVLKAINKDNFSALSQILKLVEESDNKDNIKLFPLIENIDVSDLDNLSLNVDARILVILGAKEELNDYRISFLKEVFFNRLKKEEKGVLNFANVQNPVFTPY